MKKFLTVFTVLCMMVAQLPMQKVHAATKINISENNVSGYAANNHPVKNIVDNNKQSYWKSIASDGKDGERMHDHYRYIDIKLGAVYDLTQIKMFTNTEGYNHYYVYASLDGENYSRIITKDTDTATTTNGDTFPLNVKAAYLRINMAYNSNSFQTHLNEIEVYGTKTNEKVQTPKPIEVEAWQGSTWQKEWDKFANDKAYANQKTVTEMSNMVERVLGTEWKDNFKFEIRESKTGKDTFEIVDGSQEQVIIRGNDGVSLASGFNYYLKNFAHVDYNPLFESNTTMPTTWVKVGKKIVKETQYDLRYALNFCTYSYTMSFWNWDEYQEFLDWAAMNGLNLILDIVGQEEVLRQTFEKYGYNDEEIKQYLPGPAYFAWFYMQNLYSFGGPLPNSWFKERTKLGRQIHDRMQTFGITPVMQGFCGQVPADFTVKNPKAQVTEHQEWTGFTRPAMLKTYLSAEEIAEGKPDYFAKVAETFYEAQRNVFGDITNYYAADPFHEGGHLPTGATWELIYKTVQDTMLKADQDAIWVMQQWQMNLNDAKLSGLSKPEQALGLDLISDMNPQNEVMEKYNVPWIWCMLHNFGGRMGLDGELPKIASKPAMDFAKSKHMKGIGITPEALENSPVAYELLFDMTWEKDPIDINEWLKHHAQRRAGGNSDTLQQAWQILLKTAYKDKGVYVQGAGESVVNARPTTDFGAASSWGHNNVFYEKEELDKALDLLIKNYDEFSKSPAYRYDLADVAEQVISNAALEYHKMMVSAYNSKDSKEFKRISDHFLNLIELSDQILQTSDEFMVDTWINAARKMIPNGDDWTKDLFEFNARALLTTWCGERNGGLKDYSNRKWSGLTKDFYLPRWQMWVSNRQAELDNTAKDPVAKKAESNWLLWEWKWANKKTTDTQSVAQPTTIDLKALATEALTKYSATSLKEFGGTSGPAKINVASGKLFTTNPATDEVKRKSLTDGLRNAEWSITGTDVYTFELDFNGTYDISDVELQFKNIAKLYPYNYTIELFNENNAWEEVAKSENKDLDAAVTVNLSAKKNASKIRIKLNSRDVKTALEVEEIIVNGLAVETVSYFNVAKGKEATCTKETDTDGQPLSALTDENITQLWKTKWFNDPSQMYPATVSLDLGFTCENAKFVELYFEKSGLPFKFHVETVDSSGKNTTIFTENNTTGTLDKSVYRIPVVDSVVDVKKVNVVFDGTTQQGAAGAASPAMYELKVLAETAEVQQNPIENLALTKPVKVSSINPWDQKWKPEHITDGKLETGWSYDGNKDHDTGNAEVDLQGTYAVDEIKLTFNKENYTKYYKFDIYVINDKGVKEVVFTENGANQDAYTVPVNKSIQKLGVDYKGKSQASDGWFDIAELEAWGRKPVNNEGVILGNKAETITGVSANKGYENTVNGNKNDWNKVDSEVVFDLGKCYYVDRAVFTFEKAELGLIYKVYGVDSKGNKFVIRDYSKRKGTLENREVTVNVGCAVTKIIFEHLGNNGEGPAYAAEKRLYEAEFYKGTPNDITTSATGLMFDDSLDTKQLLAANQPVEYTFTKAVDVNMVHVNSDKGTYKFELFDETTQKWVVIHSGKALASQWITFIQPIFTKQMRITATTALNVAEVAIYEQNMSGLLDDAIARVQSLIDQVNAKKHDGTNGSYKLSAIEKANTDLNAIISVFNTGKQNGMSSVVIKEKLANAEAIYADFEVNGKFYVNREGLLASILNAEDLIVKLNDAQMSDDATKLQAVITAARVVYNNYEASQQAIDAEQAKVDAAIKALPAIINRSELKALINDANALLSSCTEASKANVQAAITAAEAKLTNATTQAEIDNEVKVLRKAINQASRLFTVTIQQNGVTNDKLSFKAVYNTVKTEINAPAENATGQKFVGWYKKNGTAYEYLVTTDPNLPIAASGDVTYDAVYGSAPQEASDPAVIFTNSFTTYNSNTNKYDAKFVAKVLRLPAGAKLQEAGMYWGIGKYASLVDGNKNPIKGAYKTIVSKVNMYGQYSNTITGIPEGVVISAQMFVKYELNGIIHTLVTDEVRTIEI